VSKSILTYLLIILGCLGVSAQVDDSTVFLYDDFMNYVRNYHPITVQANLRIDQAENAITQVRGQLDPKLYSDLDQKDFDGKQYYSVWESGLKVPTWFGADFKVGYTQTSGEFLNPENTVPADGQMEIGVSVPVLRNLVYNDRRVAIEQARLLQAGTEQERRAIINELLYEATKVYWYWVQAHAEWRINAQSVEAARVRFIATRRSFFSGDKPAIDTVESLIQYQIRQFNTNESLLKFQNASLVLSNFLWYENQTPLELQESTVPPLPDIFELPVVAADSLQRFIATAAPFHPEVGQIQIALSGLDIQRKLNANNLLPELTVDYSLLSGSLDSWEDYGNSLATSNYKLGVSFSVPLFLRKERGYLDQVKAKIDETASKRELKIRQIENKIRASNNQLENLATQVLLYSQTYQNYESLYQAELRRFQIGESTLFLLNSREQKAIEARQKRAELLTKYQIAYQSIWYSGGVLE
jgi:outer membrane protein TolC